MGIQGLLPALKPITTRVHLSEFKGKTMAVDGYSWLHKGAFGCALDLCLNRPTMKYLDLCMKKTKQLLDFGIKVIVVFDGGPLPMKLLTEDRRKRKRKELLEKGKELLKTAGSIGKNRQLALECFQKCVDVTPEMAKAWIDALESIGVQSIVAPYEADSQLAWLSINGKVDAVVSEDSDLLVFGCITVIFKLKPDGNGEQIKLNDISKISEMAMWDHNRFRQMCILSGCDYLDSPPGIGVKTAMKLLKNANIYTLLDSWRIWGSAVKAPRIPKDYEDKFIIAELTFKHQWIYDLDAKECRHLIEPKGDLPDDIERFIGPKLTNDIIQGIAFGRLNPETKSPFAKKHTLQSIPIDKLTNVTAGRITLKSNIIKNQFITNSKIDSGKELTENSQNLPIQTYQQQKTKEIPVFNTDTDQNLILPNNNKSAIKPKLFDIFKKKRFLQPSKDVSITPKPPPSTKVGKKVAFTATSLKHFWKKQTTQESKSPYFQSE